MADYPKEGRNIMGTRAQRLLAVLIATFTVLVGTRSEALHNESPLITQVTDRPA